MRSYELMFVADPRLSDDEVQSLAGDYQKMIEGAGGSTGARVVKTEHWGRRKLAYPIEKQSEGRYVLFHIVSDNGAKVLADVEHRMRQNDKVLRFLTVRTDLDFKRAGMPLPSEEPEEEETAAEGGAETAEEEEES